MVEITHALDHPAIGLRVVSAFVTDEKGAVWQFRFDRSLDTGDVVAKEAVFAKDSNSLFSEPGDVAVPMEIRMELAKSFEQVIQTLYADPKAA